MISYVNSHNLRPTALESVNRFASRSEPVPDYPVAIVSPELIEAFSMQPAVAAGIVVPAAESVSEPEPEPALKQASAEVYRKSFVDQLKTAGRYNPKAMKRYVVIGIEEGKPVSLTAVDSDGIVRSEVDTLNDSAAGRLRLIISEKALATVGAKLKTDFLTIELTERQITGQHSNGNEFSFPECSLSITSGESVFSLPADSVDGIPESEKTGYSAVERLEHWNGKPFGATFAHSLTAEQVTESIRRTEYCIDSDSTRWALSGICLEFSSDQLTFAATDCRRLGIAENAAGILGTLPEDFSESVQYVLPFPAVVQLRELCSRIPADSAVCFAFSENEIVIESAAFSIRTLQVEGRFPRFREVYPKSTAVNVRFERKELLNAIESAAVVATDDSSRVDFRFYSNDSGELTGTSLHCESDELGKSNVPVLSVPAGNVSDLVNRKESGEVIDSGTDWSFDSKYVLQYLKSVKSERVYLGMNAAGSPAVFTDDDNSDAKYVLMPLRRD